ncbi:MAG TPA: thioredoxin family protein [Myxococcota bacterium]|nr:thioredoxin family protein [Myxococcota bacterium]
MLRPACLAAALAFAFAGRAAGAPSVPASAFGSTASDHGNPRLEGRLLLDHDSIRPGETLRAGLLLTMDRHWHVYWRNSGQSGAPPRLRWHVDGATVGATEWPFPQVFREADAFITTYGYTEEVLLASPVTFSATASGDVQVRLDADVLVCEIQCIPGELHLARPVRVASESLASAEHELFETWSARVPRPVGARDIQLEALYSQSAIRPGDDFDAALAVHDCGAARPGECAPLEPASASPEDAFVPDAAGGLELSVTGARRAPSPGSLLLALRGRADANPGLGESRLRGVLGLRSGGRPDYVEVDLPLPRAAAGAVVTKQPTPWLDQPPLERGSFAPALPLWQAFALALLGGLVLNAMPCVLPVLAVKVFGLAELAHHGRARILQHGIAYTAGVLASMAALAGVVIALRAAGASVGWGFQFQEPLFVAAIAAVLVVFALSLFGVFEFRLDVSELARAGESAEGARRSFFEGLLAVVLATPCTAPFLGTAVGFAFAGSAATVVAIFLAIGVGLAAPFLAICAVPSWARLVPRSGPWMLQLRAALGFSLLATVVWLLWILGRSDGADAQAALLAYLCALAAGVWITGALQQRESNAPARIAALAVLALAALGLRALPVHGEPPAAASAAEAPRDLLEGQRFSARGVDAARARGEPVFVYFTAEWCLTCKVNERVVLDDARVRSALTERRFAVFKGDWTRGDAAIRDELARFGKAGVPLYLVYAPNPSARPIVLPELLTVDLFLKALADAAPATEEKT